jgi:nitrite reductase (NO-forming)
MRFSTRVASVAASVVALGAVSAPALAAHTQTKASTITVTASEFKFKLSTASAKHGTVTFKVVNKGKLPHDFKIGGKKTPLLNPGKSATLKVVLKAGKQKYLCTVAGHAAAGMKGTLTVK